MLENKAKKKEYGNFSEEIRKKYGCVYTPDFVIKKTVDLVWDKVNNKLDKKFIDPACGDGNFLMELYSRLMVELEGDISCPIERSYHILTKNLYGVEILSTMAYACRVRLCLEHFKLVNSLGGDVNKYKDLFKELKIYHGNTILVPGDKEPEEAFEGGMLSEKFRAMKFDCIVGNPPYTHLRNMDNYKYVKYPKQRDMAQVFVRWALDNMAEDGCCSYNIADKWLNTKLNDGAKETKKLVNGKIIEILMTEDIKSYSVDSGGSNTTTIMLFSNNYQDNHVIINGKSIKVDINRCNWMHNFNLKYIFIHKNVSSIISHLGEVEGTAGSTPLPEGMFFSLDNSKKHRLLINKALARAGQFRIIECQDQKEISKYAIGKSGKSEIKYTNNITFEEAMWLAGYFNTSVAISYYKSFCTELAGGKIWRISHHSLNEAEVPDLDWYKTNRPAETAAYLKWVEDNMEDKDAFLAGIDEQFEKLIEGSVETDSQDNIEGSEV